MRPKLALYLFLAVAVVGAATYGAIRFFAPATDHAIALVPKDAVAYASAFLRPSTTQRRALKAIVESFPASDTDAEAEALFDRVIAELLSELGLDYDEDVRPWLGTEIATFALAPEPGADPDAAVVIATKDEEASMEAVREAETQSEPEADTYRDIEYLKVDQGAAGVVDGFLVVGTEGAFKATVDVAAEEDASLADAPKLRNALAPLPEDRLALFYVDTPALLEAVAAEQDIPPALLTGRFFPDGPSAGVLYARKDELVVDIATDDAAEEGAASSDAPSADVLAGLSGRIWAGVNVPELGRTVGTVIDRVGASGLPGAGFALDQQLRQATGLRLGEDLLDWMGDAALFIQETDPEAGLGGGLVIRSTQPSVSRRVVDRLHGLLLGRFDAPVRSILMVGALGERLDRRSLLEGRSGFAIWGPGMVNPINVVADGDRVLVIYGAYATFDALNGGTRLDQALSYQAARESMDDGFDLGGFLAVPPLLEVVDNVQRSPDENWATEVKPNLQSIAHVVFGSKREGGLAIHRLVVHVE